MCNRVRPFSSILDSAKFEFFIEGIAEEEFPDLECANPEDAILYKAERQVSYDDVLAQMVQDGCRPSNLRELLTWMLKNWNCEDAVFAPGQLRQYPELGMPYITKWNWGLGLNIFYLSLGKVIAGCCFLAFPGPFHHGRQKNIPIAQMRLEHSQYGLSILRNTFNNSNSQY